MQMIRHCQGQTADDISMCFANDKGVLYGLLDFGDRELVVSSGKAADCDEIDISFSRGWIHRQAFVGKGFSSDIVHN